jgi:adenylate cyclase
MIGVPVVAILYVAASLYAFAKLRLFMPIASPVFVAAPVTFVIAILVRYRFVRSLIMRLEPAPIARRMLAKMRSERGTAISGEATVVFFDLIGSTAIGEKIAPVAFSTLLNNYHETVTRAVGQYRGFVSAYSGDGVTAVFTSEDAGSDHAVRACRSALAVVRELQVVNATNTTAGLPALSTRIGINSGIVAEGEMGARDRFNFSVVGDVVNLAARLEQLGKTLFPGEKDIILVGRSTVQMAEKKDLSFLNCGTCAIQGRESPESVYRLSAKQEYPSTVG